MDTNTKLKAAVELKGIRAVTLRFGHAAKGGLVEVYSIRPSMGLCIRIRKLKFRTWGLSFQRRMCIFESEGL